MAAHPHFSFSVEADGLPTWTSPFWKVTLDGDQVVARDLSEHQPLPEEVAGETYRSVVEAILNGDDQWDASLTAMVLAAGQYRDAHHRAER